MQRAKDLFSFPILTCRLYQWFAVEDADYLSVTQLAPFPLLRDTLVRDMSGQQEKESQFFLKWFLIIAPRILYYA